MNNALDVLSRIDGGPLLGLLVVCAAVYTVTRVAAESFEVVAKILGPLGRRWQRLRDVRAEGGREVKALREKLARCTKSCERLQSRVGYLEQQRQDDKWNLDLQRQVALLDASVRRLRRRGEVTEAYLVYDSNWHLRQQLGQAEEHVVFLEFEQEWLREHPSED